MAPRWMNLQRLRRHPLQHSLAEQSAPASPAAAPAPRADIDSRPLVPPRPDDPRAGKVYTIFESYCARCHQSGKLEKSLAAGGFANILALNEIAHDRTLVVPGVPDASPVFDVMQSRHGALDVVGSGLDELAPEDVTAVRDWIRELPESSQACSGREPIKSNALEGWIDEALRIEREGAKDLRFISLVNLYNACASSEELAASRQAIAKLLNGLSWAAAPHRLQSVDPYGTLLAFASFRIRLGWRTLGCS